MTARYAVYFVPGDSSPLAKFGREVFGRTATAESVEKPVDDHPNRFLLTRNPAHYGFHATLQAPFELALDQSLASLEQAVAIVAETTSPVALSGLVPQRTGENLSLCLPTPIPALQQLAGRCVVELNSFRKPLDSIDLKRRRRAVQSKRQKHSLEHYGYAKVFDDFLFHMTLTRSPTDFCSNTCSNIGGINPTDMTRCCQHAETTQVPSDQSLFLWLLKLFADQVTDTPVLDRLTICYQESRSAPFVRLSEWTFGAAGD